MAPVHVIVAVLGVTLIGCATLTPQHRQQLAQYEGCGGRAPRTVASMLKHGVSLPDAVVAVNAFSLRQQGVPSVVTNEQARAMSVATPYADEMPAGAHSDTVRCLEQRHGYKVTLPK